MINPQEWLRTRKNLLEQVKTQVELRVGRPPWALRQYAKNLDNEFRGPWKPSRHGELAKALRRAKIVLSGDFHAYSQSQRAHYRILRDFVPDRRVNLVMECLPKSRDREIRAYLNGKMSETRFLKAIGWDRIWGFPFEHYRPLMALARYRGYSVYGLNSGGGDSLKRRDREMAREIERIQDEDPEALTYVIVGEWHLARQHLPGQLRRRFKSPEDLLVLFQDIESLYFRLARSRKEGSVEYMKGGGNRFCVMVSPPWMKWQSYLMYLEQVYDHELGEIRAIDYSDHVASLVEWIAEDMKLNVSRSRIQVYCPDSKTSLSRVKLTLPRRFNRILTYHLEHDLSFFLPEKDWLYLSRPTINHASALAGYFIHGQLSSRKRTLWDLPRDFIPLVWTEAMGFFFSKWINPKRKAESWESMRLRLQASHPKDKGRAALLIALDQRLSEVVWLQTGRIRKSRLKVRDSGAWIEASRMVGNLLGERMYEGVRARRISLKRLHEALMADVESEGFANFYREWIRELEVRRKS